MIINKTQLGEDWPFTVDEVELWHRKGMETLLIHKDISYIIASSFEIPFILPLIDSNIWADDPEIPGVKKSLSPLFKFLEGKQNV